MTGPFLTPAKHHALNLALRSNCWKERFVVTDFLNNPLVWLEAELAYHTYRTRGAAQDVGNRIDRMIQDGKKTDMEMYGCWKLRDFRTPDFRRSSFEHWGRTLKVKLET